MRTQKNVLVVDDSVTMRRMVMATLQRIEGCQFDQAQSGLEAIERLAMSLPDLVILDLNMPDIHGLEVLRFIRSHESFAGIPVIILTTRGDDESRAAAIADGATLYLTKPFNPSIFASEAARLLSAD